MSVLIGLVALKPVRDFCYFIYVVATEEAIGEEIILCHGERFDARVIRINEGGATVGFQYEVNIAERGNDGRGQHVVWDSYRVEPSRLYWQDRNTLVVVFSEADLSDGWRTVNPGGRVRIKELAE